MIIVLGTVRLPAEALEQARPAMAAMVDASRSEAGCLDYAYAEDVLQPGLIRVMERWTDQASLDAHRLSTHMAQWRASWPALGLGERDLIQFEAGPPVKI